LFQKYGLQNYDDGWVLILDGNLGASVVMRDLGVGLCFGFGFGFTQSRKAAKEGAKESAKGQLKVESIKSTKIRNNGQGLNKFSCRDAMPCVRYMVLFFHSWGF